MGLITRQIGPDAKGSKLTFADMDNNLYYLQGIGVSGFTYSANTLTITNPTGGTTSVNIASDTNTFITATTYNQSTNTITLTDNANTSFNVYIDSVSGLTVNGVLSATTISGGTLYGDGSNLTGISTQDTFVTGGTYSNGTAIFTNNTGGTFNVNGFFTGSTDVFVTGGTFSSSTITFTNNTGGTFSVSGISSETNLSKTLFVDPNGNDVTAVKGNINKPYLNLYTAKSAATSGDTIYVLPGTWTYDNRNTAGNPYDGQMDTLVNLWKDGVSYFFSPNSKVVFFNQTQTGDDMYLFKSPGSGGTCTVRGSLEFSGDSIGADTFGGAVIFYEPGTGDGCTFDCEVKSLTSKSHLIGARSNVITGQTSIIKITADEMNFTHTGNNVGQSGIGSPIVIRSTSQAQYYITARKVKSTFYRVAQFRDLSTGSIAILNAAYVESLGSNDAISCEINSSPNIMVNIDKCDYVGRPYETATNASTFKFIGNINWYEVGDVGITTKFTSNSGTQGTTILNGYYNFKFNRAPFSNTSLEKMHINGTINFETSNFTNVVFNNGGSGEINFQGNIFGNFQGVVARPRAGKINIKNSTILPSITGGTFINNDTTTTGTTVISNTNAFFNSSSNLINGQYLKNYILNSNIKNSSTGNLFVNTTSTGSLQIHNSTLQSVSGSTINITGSAPLTISNTTSNTNITASTINGSVTVLTELDLL